jgi:hypothetical protein
VLKINGNGGQPFDSTSGTTTRRYWFWPTMPLISLFLPEGPPGRLHDPARAFAMWEPVAA